MRQFLRYGFGYTLTIIAQFAQWFCLLMILMSGAHFLADIFTGDWNLALLAVAASIGWALGAFVSVIFLHAAAYFLP